MGQHTIVPMTKEHVAGAVEMHMLDFPGFFLTFLGRGFLTEFSKAAAGHEQTVGHVAVAPDGHVVGACFGLMNAKGFFRKLVKKLWWAFGWHSMGAILQCPSIIPRMLRALRHESSSQPLSVEPLGSLQSTAVQPGAQGTGLAIALMRTVWH